LASEKRLSNGPDLKSYFHRELLEASEGCCVVTWLLYRKALIRIRVFEGEEGESFGDVFIIRWELNLLNGRTASIC
jgi:hypothetical protein